MFRGVGIFVDAVNGRDLAVPHFLRDRFIGREHKFLDELMRFVVFDALEFHRFAVRIDMHLYLRKIEIERAMLEPFSTEKRGKIPCDVQALAQLVFGR